MTEKKDLFSKGKTILACGCLILGFSSMMLSIRCGQLKNKCDAWEYKYNKIDTSKIDGRDTIAYKMVHDLPFRTKVITIVMAISDTDLLIINRKNIK